MKVWRSPNGAHWASHCSAWFLTACHCLVLPSLGWKDAHLDIVTEGRATHNPSSPTRIRWAMEEGFPPGDINLMAAVSLVLILAVHRWSQSVFARPGVLQGLRYLWQNTGMKSLQHSGRTADHRDRQRWGTPRPHCIPWPCTGTSKYTLEKDLGIQV